MCSTFCHQSEESTINQSSNAIIVIEIRTLYSWREITKPIIPHGWIDGGATATATACFHSIHSRYGRFFACISTTRISIIWPDIWKASGWFLYIRFGMQIYTHTHSETGNRLSSIKAHKLAWRTPPCISGWVFGFENLVNHKIGSKKTILLKPDPFKKCNGKNHKTHAISGKRRKLFVTPLNAVMVLLMIMKSPTLQTSCPIKQSRTEHNKLNASLF